MLPSSSHRCLPQARSARDSSSELLLLSSAAVVPSSSTGFPAMSSSWYWGPSAAGSMTGVWYDWLLTGGDGSYGGAGGSSSSADSSSSSSTSAVLRRVGITARVCRRFPKEVWTLGGTVTA